MKTTVSARPEDMEAQRVWYIMDAADKPLGRLAVDAAKVLRGKHKPIFTPHVDTGDHVIIINAGKVALTGANKPGESVYHHTGWPGAQVSGPRRPGTLDSAAGRRDGDGRPLRRDRPLSRRRSFRTGGSGAARHLEGAAGSGPGTAAAPAPHRPADPRPARQRA